MTSRLARNLYGLTILLGAFLLFAVEPMAAKQLLPALGGSSAVWITCLVFFQTALLAGYLYAHWLSQRPAARAWPVHLALLLLAAAAAVFALWHTESSSGSGSPVAAIFAA